MQGDTTLPDAPPPYKVPQVAKLLDVHSNNVLRMIHNGEIEATKLGKQWFIPRKQIDDLLGLQTAA